MLALALGLTVLARAPDTIVMLVAYSKARGSAVGLKSI